MVIDESCPLKKSVLITGAPGVGKTTAIKRIIKALGKDAGGFYTEEIREDGVRKGFKLITLDGMEGTLAHVDLRSKHRVGKYGVDVDTLEKLGVEAVEHAIRSGRVVVIDEIGKMEMFSIRFREAVLASILNPQPMVATIQEKSNPFCDLLKKRSDVTIIKMNRGNRDEVAQEALRILGRYISPNASC